MIKSILFLAILLAPALAFTQQAPLKVYLNNGAVINTNYVYLYYTNFKGAVVKIDGKKGDILNATEVDYVEGINQEGDSIYATTALFQGRPIWVSRIFKSDRIEIFTQSLQQINFLTGFNYTWKLDYYRKDKGRMVSAKYRQMKYDLSDSPASAKYLKRANGARIAQFILYGAGVGLVVAGISSFSQEDNRPGPGAGPNSDTGFSVPPTMIGAVACFAIPLLLNPSKQDNFIKALKAYE